jgi:hypothetical protein
MTTNASVKLQKTTEPSVLVGPLPGALDASR